VRKSPAKARPYLNLSRAYLDNGDVALGVANIQEGIKRGTNGQLKGKELVAAYINLAAAYYSQNEMQKAAEALKTIEHEAVNHHEYHHSLGLIYMKQGRYDLALTGFTKALAILPSSPTFFYLIGECYAAMGDHETAKDYFTRASRGIPQSGPDHLYQGLAFSKLGDEDAMITLLYEAVKADPLDLTTRLSLAETLLSRGSFDGARRQYALAIEFAPRSVSAYRGMALTLLSRGAVIEARKYLLKALSMLPPDSPERAGLLELLSKAPR
jgi:tetratricopeptide (TPR) repeat protein